MMSQRRSSFLAHLARHVSCFGVLSASVLIATNILARCPPTHTCVAEPPFKRSAFDAKLLPVIGSVRAEQPAASLSLFSACALLSDLVCSIESSDFAFKICNFLRCIRCYLQFDITFDAPLHQRQTQLLKANAEPSIKRRRSVYYKRDLSSLARCRTCRRRWEIAIPGNGTERSSEVCESYWRFRCSIMLCFLVTSPSKH